MFTFGQELGPGKFVDLHSQQIKQAVLEARAADKKNIYVSKQWFNTVKPTLKALVHPAPTFWDDERAGIKQLGVAFIVDPALKDNEFEVK